jgi:hypothetical protein
MSRDHIRQIGSRCRLCDAVFMLERRARLNLPAQLRVVVLGGATALACSNSSSLTPFDGGPCTIHVPEGKVCETACYYAQGSVGIGPVTCPPMTFACQLYCDVPEGGATTGACFEADGAFNGCGCTLTVLSNGDTQVLC